MTVKQQVLSILEMEKGRVISGSELAERMHVSRNAVWKAVKALEAEGYEISASSGKGYCYLENNDFLSAQRICAYLPQKLQNLQIKTKKLVTSTNVILKSEAENGRFETDILLAEEQSAGKGRRGRSFYSPPQSGLYMSFLLRPQIPAESAVYITTAAAVAVAEAIEHVTGKKTEIKWVNDIFCEQKKVCGILTEASLDFETGMVAYAVLGIGINIGLPKNGFPKELQNIASSVMDGYSYDSGLRNRLAAEVIKRFYEYYENLTKKQFLHAYRERSFLIGKEITYLLGETQKCATVLDIDEEAHLVVRFLDGTVEALSSGEVSNVRRKTV